MRTKPDIILSAVMMRIFCKPLRDGRYLAPGFMYDVMDYWQNCPPKPVFGKKLIVCHMPMECDAAVVTSDKVTVSLSEMARNIEMIPTDLLASRARMFVSTWDAVAAYTDGLNKQVGIRSAEFERLQVAFGPGAWEREILVTDLEMD